MHKDGENGQELDAQTDEDVQRAKDLVELHYNVKMKHAEGHSGDLKQARSDVDAVLQRLGEKPNEGERTA